MSADERGAANGEAGGGVGGEAGGKDFIRTAVEADLREGRNDGRIHTRFPPEPNGYLHIGHAKAICLDFSVAAEYGGLCNLRFDDTNPIKEEQEFVDSQIEDIRWLGYDWGDRLFFASDYYERLYRYAEQLIGEGTAYVDSLDADQMREYRGTLTEPGRDSPYRNRSVEENLDLFRRMRAGQFPDGSHVLRAKIDMASPNLNMRDPTLYRIRRAHHHRTGDAWCIYPMYDYAHPLSDAIEGITHSFCTLEYEAHRPLYDWVVAAVHHENRPRQIEFAPLVLSYVVLSKRRLTILVKEGHVAGWDDPRMPTLSGLRRRGYPAEAIRTFCDRIGVAKRDSVVDVGLLEHTVREVLNRTASRAMGVLRPVKVVLDNYPEGQVEWFEAQLNPEDPSAGMREVPFSRELFIEEDDFRDPPPPKYHRLYPGAEVRLRAAYLITCREVIRDGEGRIVELRCTYDPETRGGHAPDGRKVKGTIHWVSAAHAVDAEVRLIEHLFATADASAQEDFVAHLNPSSMEVLRGCKMEPGLAQTAPGESFQLERLGYFCVDPKDSRPAALVLNRTVTLRDSWAKIEKAQQG